MYDPALPKTQSGPILCQNVSMATSVASMTTECGLYKNEAIKYTPLFKDCYTFFAYLSAWL